MARVSVYLEDELHEEINCEVEADGVSRSCLIQTVLTEYLHEKRQHESRGCSFSYEAGYAPPCQTPAHLVQSRQGDPLVSFGEG